VIGLTGSASARYRQLVLITLTDHLLWFTWNYQVITFSESLTHGRCLSSCSLGHGFDGSPALFCLELSKKIHNVLDTDNHPSMAHFKGPFFGPARYCRKYGFFIFKLVFRDG